MKTLQDIIAGLILQVQDRPDFIITKENVKDMIINDINKIAEEILDEVWECK